MIIRIAAAECFTQGNVGREIHAFSRGYPGMYSWGLSQENYRLSLVAGLFIPTLSGLRDILGIDPLLPAETIDNIKVYDQSSDVIMARIMAEAVREITGATIGIGTSAGIGKGGIALVTDTRIMAGTSSIYADLCTSGPGLICERQRSGLITTLKLLECLLENDFPPEKYLKS